MKIANNCPRPLALIILDGWGYSENAEFNAIAQANTPIWDDLWAHSPHILLDASALAVGLPDGQMGNSEVGHLNLGAGRVVYQDYTRVSLAIKDGSFYKNPNLINAVQGAVKNNAAVHIFGLLSDGGVHSHEEHLIAMFELAAMQGAEKIYFHAFLDGRDTPPQSAAVWIEKVEKCFKKLQKGRFATVSGRYYAMDRDKRWDRVERAYRAIVDADGEFVAPNAMIALQNAYARGENDEFVKPTIIEPAVKMENGDAIIFMNFRSDRARQITRAFIEENFEDFQRNRVIKLSNFVCLTEYHKDFKTPIAFPPQSLNKVLGEVISTLGLKQLRIAETEKYAHVTFFFNGGEEKVYEGEDRILIPSPKVATYDLKPDMSAPEVTEKLISAIKENKYDVIICNFANTDMVGHTGFLDAAIKAVETVDSCLGEIRAAIEQQGGEMLITADHGNAEKLFDPETNQPHTAHTTNLVPFIYVGKRNITFSKDQGILADVAPTLLNLMQISIPQEMTGTPLIQVLS
ncbi:MAG: 2,3-bisphosphoglycerate-independent phosphoglycerate mutase [Pseudomonadota bacterium]|jgi:2,3-bisphosphoglycerate-independent phosphoglycerate mutase